MFNVTSHNGGKWFSLCTFNICVFQKAEGIFLIIVGQTRVTQEVHASKTNPK